MVTENLKSKRTYLFALYIIKRQSSTQVKSAIEYIQ